MFMGEYNHTIDAKGRLIIPSRFRELLGEEFVLTRGLDGCLSIYPMDEWVAFEEKLRALPLTNKDARTFSRFFVAGATTCQLDKQGRILVPQTLRQFAGLDKDVWSHITDLRLYIRGQSSKTLEQIEDELDITEYYCRPYADVDDVDDV